MYATGYILHRYNVCNVDWALYTYRLSAQIKSPFVTKEPVRDEGAEGALVEPLGPNTGIFQS